MIVDPDDPGRVAVGDSTVALVVLGVIVAVALLVSWWRR